MSRFSHSVARRDEATLERFDVTANSESCLRVDGGPDGAEVQNAGPCPVDHAVSTEVEADGEYSKATTLAVGKTVTVKKDTLVDFWAVGAGRSRLIVTR